MDNPIGNYLAKFLKFSPPELAVRTTLIEVLKENYNIFLKPDQISVDEDSIKIHCQPIIKTTILLNREKILSFIESKLGKKIKNIF